MFFATKIPFQRLLSTGSVSARGRHMAMRGMAIGTVIPARGGARIGIFALLGGANHINFYKNLIKI